MNIRKALIEDLKQLAILFDQYRVFYGKESDLEGASKFLEERIRNEESIIFVAENANKEAVAFIQLYPLFSSTRMQRMWLLNDLFVAHNARRNGVSRLLIECTKDHCRKTMGCEIMLETQKENLPANALYQATGFVMNQHNFYYWELDGH